MYTVKIASGSVKEINNVMQTLKLNLWQGVEFETYEEAEIVGCKAYDIEPWIEIDITAA
jgi:hypothetical protein